MLSLNLVDLIQSSAKEAQVIKETVETEEGRRSRVRKMAKNKATKAETAIYIDQVRYELENGNTRTEDIVAKLNLSKGQVYYAFCKMGYNPIYSYSHVGTMKRIILTRKDGSEEVFRSIGACAFAIGMHQSSVSRMLNTKVKSKEGYRVRMSDGSM